MGPGWRNRGPCLPGAAGPQSRADSASLERQGRSHVLTLPRATGSSASTSTKRWSEPCVSPRPRMSPRSSSSTWMCPPCHQLTPRTSSASAEWMTSCSGLQGRGRRSAGLSSFPSSGNDGIGGLFSAPQDRGAVQLQHHSSAAPGKTSPSTASQGEKWGGLNLGGGGG